MTRSIRVDWQTVVAVATHAAKNEVRYYLNGVYLDTERGRIVATDGHRMMVAPAPEIIDGGPGVILPSDLIETVGKAWRRLSKNAKLSAAELPVTLGEDMAVTIAIPGSTAFSGKVIDGKFPDYMRVIPMGFSGQAGQFNPAYIKSASDALQVLVGAETPALVYHDGPERACIVQHPGSLAFCVVMGVRTYGVLAPDTAWVREPLKQGVAA